MKDDIEEWRKLTTLPDVEVSEFGRLRTLVKGKLYTLKSRDNGKGYWSVNRNNKTYYVHRLVAEAFLGGVQDLQVNHKDGNKANNHWTNLEWVTPESNRAHAVRTGLIAKTFDDEQTKVVWFMRDCGMPVAEIARQMNTSRQPIYTVLERNRT